MNIEAGSVGQGGSATSLSLMAVAMVYGCMDRKTVPLILSRACIDADTLLAFKAVLHAAP